MAATVSDTSYPYDAGAGKDVLESQWRTMASWWLTDGPVRGELSSFAVSATTGRALAIAAGRCWVRGAFGEFSGTTTVNFGTNTSGNPRIDLVILRNNFSGNQMEMDVLQGTPAGSPTVPALTQNTVKWEVPLFQVAIANAFTGLTTGNATDVRAWAQGRPAGGPTVIACMARRTTSLSFPHDVDTAVTFSDDEPYDTGGIHSLLSNASRFTIPDGMTGLWSIEIDVSVNPTSDLAAELRLYKNGSSIRTLQRKALNGVDNPDQGWSLEGQSRELCAPGDYLQPFVYRFGDASSANVSFARASMLYLGPVS